MHIDIIVFDVFCSDTDGFVIPSLGIGDSDSSKTSAPQVDLKTASPKVRRGLTDLA